MTPASVLIPLRDFLFPRRVLKRTGGDDNLFLTDRERRSRKGHRPILQRLWEGALLLVALRLAGVPFLPLGMAVPLFALLLQRFYLFVNSPKAQTRFLREESIDHLYLTPLGGREYFIEPFLACRFPRLFLASLGVVAVSWGMATSIGASLEGPWIRELAPALFPPVQRILALALMTSVTGPAQYALEWRCHAAKRRLLARPVFSWAISYALAGFNVGVALLVADLTPLASLLTLAGIYLGSAWCLCQMASAMVGDGIGFLWKPIIHRDPGRPLPWPINDWTVPRSVMALLVPVVRPGLPQAVFDPATIRPERDAGDPFGPRAWLWSAGILFGLVSSMTNVLVYRILTVIVTVSKGGETPPMDFWTLLHQFLPEAALFLIPTAVFVSFVRLQPLLRQGWPPSLAMLITLNGRMVAGVCFALALLSVMIHWVGQGFLQLPALDIATLPFVLFKFYLRFLTYWFLLVAASLHLRLVAVPSRTGPLALALLCAHSFAISAILTILWVGHYGTVSGTVDAFLTAFPLTRGIWNLSPFFFEQWVVDGMYLMALVIALASVKGRFSQERLQGRRGTDAPEEEAEERTLRPAVHAATACLARRGRAAGSRVNTLPL